MSSKKIKKDYYSDLQNYKQRPKTRLTIHKLDLCKFKNRSQANREFARSV